MKLVLSLSIILNFILAFQVFRQHQDINAFPENKHFVPDQNTPTASSEQLHGSGKISTSTSAEVSSDKVALPEDEKIALDNFELALQKKALALFRQQKESLPTTERIRDHFVKTSQLFANADEVRAYLDAEHDAASRIFVLEVLGKSKEETATTILLDLYKTPGEDNFYRPYLADALTEKNDPRIVSALHSFLDSDDDDRRVRIKVAKTLITQFRDEKARESLLKILNESKDSFEKDEIQKFMGN